MAVPTGIEPVRLDRQSSIIPVDHGTKLVADPDPDSGDLQVMGLARLPFSISASNCIIPQVRVMDLWKTAQ